MPRIHTPLLTPVQHAGGPLARRTPAVLLRLSRCTSAQSKRLEKEKEVPVKGAKNKNLVRIEKELAHENRDMAVLRMKSSMAAGISHAMVFSYIYNKYDGQSVARLPFEPFTFIRQISHRNVPGNDYCECSVVFFYMLCSLCLRPNLQRALGFAPSNTPSLMVRACPPPSDRVSAWPAHPSALARGCACRGQPSDALPTPMFRICKRKWWKSFPDKSCEMGARVGRKTKIKSGARLACQSVSQSLPHS